MQKHPPSKHNNSQRYSVSGQTPHVKRQNTKNMQAATLDSRQEKLVHTSEANMIPKLSGINSLLWNSFPHTTEHRHLERTFKQTTQTHVYLSLYINQNARKDHSFTTWLQKQPLHWHSITQHIYHCNRLQSKSTTSITNHCSLTPSL